MDKKYIISYSIPSKKKHLRIKSSIPYTIIQTMKTNRVPQKMYNAAMSWSNKNPEYDYEFFDDNRIIEFIKSNYDDNILTKFMVINIGAAKADFFRWLYLYKYGGVYIDIDSECLNPIHNLSKKYQNINNIFISKSIWTQLKDVGFDYKGHRINHNLIFSSPNHFLLKKAIDNSLLVFNKAYKNKKNIQMPQDLCGPSVLGISLNIILNRSRLSHFFPNVFKFNRKLGNFTVILLSPDLVLNYIMPKYQGYGMHYGKYSPPAFSFIQCKKYLNENNIDMNGNKLNLIN